MTSQVLLAYNYTAYVFLDQLNGAKLKLDFSVDFSVAIKARLPAIQFE